MVAGCVPGVKGKFDWEQEVTQQHSVFNSRQRGCEGRELGELPWGRGTESTGKGCPLLVAA